MSCFLAIIDSLFFILPFAKFDFFFLTLRFFFDDILSLDEMSWPLATASTTSGFGLLKQSARELGMDQRKCTTFVEKILASCNESPDQNSLAFIIMSILGSIARSLFSFINKGQLLSFK